MRNRRRWYASTRNVIARNVTTSGSGPGGAPDPARELAVSVPGGTGRKHGSHARRD